MSADHQADLDGNCESCGLAVGFSGAHTSADCIAALREAVRLFEVERERPIHLVVSLPYGDSIAISAFGQVEDAANELRRLRVTGMGDARSLHVMRPPTGLRNAPAHGPDKRGSP